FTQSFISNVSEYPDAVHVTAIDALDPPIGAFLQQKSTVAVQAITLQTNVADALMRWILVTATGTETAGNQESADVDQVGLWYDVPNTGVFNAGTDVLVGTGTFGDYQGLPQVAQINMFTPIHVVTPGLAPQPQRYFITYHMSPTAAPTDAAQQPRTMGASLLATALPTNSPINDNPFLNALSLPNYYDVTSPLPFSSKLRAIIPSPQVMQVQATPYFSTSSGTFPAPWLTAPIPLEPAGQIDPVWVVSSTQGLPVPLANATDYLVVDGEIVGYTGFGAVPGVIQNVSRGSLNTVPAAHFGGVSSGTTVSPQVEQGQTNLAGLRLDLWSQEPDGTPGFQVQLSSIDLTR
ncbi:MAG: hypothetical protein ACRDL8_20960, partial [Solirubrobacteraceae bacterium]